MHMLVTLIGCHRAVSRRLFVFFVQLQAPFDTTEPSLDVIDISFRPMDSAGQTGELRSHGGDSHAARCRICLEISKIRADRAQMLESDIVCLIASLADFQADSQLANIINSTPG